MEVYLKFLSWLFILDITHTMALLQKLKTLQHQALMLSRQLFRWMPASAPSRAFCSTLYFLSLREMLAPEQLQSVVYPITSSDLRSRIDALHERL